MTPGLIVLAVTLARLLLGEPTCQVPHSPWTLRAGDKTYAPVLTCGDVRVLETAVGDSALRDLARLVATRGYGALRRGGPLVLQIDLPAHPVTAGDVWPTPPGNLYLALHVTLPPEAAARRVAEVAAGLARQAVIGTVASGLAFTVRVDVGHSGEAYAGVRAGDSPQAPFVAGISALPGPEGSALVGLDLHLGATPAAYGRHSRDHVSLATWTGRAPPRLEVLGQAVLALQSDLAR
jgi:hypothetical protein